MAAPALPIPPKAYSQDYLNELVRTLRLYFIGQVDVNAPPLPNSSSQFLSGKGAYTTLVVEPRTDDPASPVVGQLWLRTDL